MISKRENNIIWKLYNLQTCFDFDPGELNFESCLFSYIIVQGYVNEKLRIAILENFELEIYQ